jgi:lipoyl(octanoyl) transferase
VTAPAVQRSSTISTQWLGRRRYAEVWELQRALLAERVRALEAGEPGVDRLLLVEHEPVYTWGKRTNPAHLGAGVTALRALGADCFEVERGGEVTFHGPGQLVGYPIVYLGNLACGRDLHKYMRGLEEVVIRALATWGLRGQRLKGLTGVWVDGAKIAALGVRVSKWCAMHGFALNVTNEVLPWFGHITPCGIKGRGVTSIETLLGRAPDMAEVRARVEAAFHAVFAR